MNTSETPSQSEQKASKLHPHRWRLGVVLMFSVFVAYLDRQNITFAIPLMAEEFGWTIEETRDYGAMMISLFYIGYGLSNIFLTPFAARFGPRQSLILIIILWSLLTAAGAWLSQFMMLFAASRVALGLTEGVHFPLMNQMTHQWFPLSERSKANGLWVAGLYLAIVSGPLIIVPTMVEYGWKVIFIGMALLSLIFLLPLVVKYVHNTPNKQAIRTEKVSLGPTLKTIKRPEFLLLFSVTIIHNILTSGMVNWLPTYLTTTLNVDFEDLQWLTTLPYIPGILALGIFAYFGDRFNNRILLASIGYLFAGAFIYLMFTSSDTHSAIGYYTLASLMVCAFTCAEFAILQRIVNANHIAAVAGIHNGGAMLIGGGIGPFVVSQVITDTPQNIHPAALLFFGLSVVISLILMLLYRRLRY
ncbi:MFS transporter [Temperatibacter marinus]|uniref:MFS transporter n=1 Tax=Temperatibacter marinus TaxID=1456591 RepID=A0AA52EIH8_9PROT|nr:MFS transporter [Temperatibacter marinus]WND02924.1 MFS transporter [Temperatibacter marinus]